MSGSDADLDAKVRSIIQQPVASAKQIFVIALLAIALWAAVSAWILGHAPSEGERAGIQNMAETIATAAFFYYLGSSAGSRNKDQKV
jgi:hypothetical protein